MKVKLGRGGIELVDFQAASGGGRGDVFLACAGMADTQYCPRACGRIPEQPVSLQFSRQIENGLWINGSRREHRRRECELSGHAVVEIGLGHPIDDARGPVKNEIGNLALARRRHPHETRPHRCESARTRRDDPVAAWRSDRAHQGKRNAIGRRLDLQTREAPLQRRQDGEPMQLHRFDELKEHRRIGRNFGRRFEQAVAEHSLGQLRAARTHARKRLLVGHRFRRWRREGNDIGIAIETLVGVRTDEVDLHAPTACDGGLGPRELLHGHLRRDPRASTARPTGCVVHADINAQSISLLNRVRHERAPIRIQVARRACRQIIAAVEHHHAPYPDPVHGFEVQSDALARDVAIHPQPKRARTGVGWRRREASRERVR